MQREIESGPVRPLVAYMIIIHPICNVIYIGEHLSIVDNIVIYLCLFFSYFLFVTIASFWWNKRIYIRQTRLPPKAADF